MKDIQNSSDQRQLPLNKVGIKELLYPITVLDKENETQNTTAKVSLFANLPHHFRGTHMSRFVEVFQRYYKNIGMKNFLAMLEDIRTSLEAESAFGELDFNYFINKTAPVSGQKSMMNYYCSLVGEVSEDGTHSFFAKVRVPVKTLCPCSKEISERGAHNQRGEVTVTIKVNNFFWFEDIIAIVESCASSPLYTLLKRPDEKFVTEHAYDNPRFVEDMVREVVVAIEKKFDFPYLSVEAENFESIHNHNAYAFIERGRKDHD